MSFIKRIIIIGYFEFSFIKLAINDKRNMKAKLERKIDEKKHA